VRITVIIPAHNEEKTIGKVVSRVKKVCSCEVIVVDDASNDDTIKIAKEKEAIIIKNPTRMGPSAAVQRGIIEANGSVVITIDADLDHYPEEIPKLLTVAQQKADIVIGERRCLPRLSERLLAFLTYITIGLKDPLSGFRLYNKNIFSKVSFGRFETYSMLLLARSISHGFKVVGVPIEARLGKKTRSSIGYSIKVDFRILVSGLVFFLALLCGLIYHKSKLNLIADGLLRHN
jgi:glycosyltransferase involved in cell wall biosynthesis